MRTARTAEITSASRELISRSRRHRLTSCLAPISPPIITSVTSSFWALSTSKPPTPPSRSVTIGVDITTVDDPVFRGDRGESGELGGRNVARPPTQEVFVGGLDDRRRVVESRDVGRVPN